MTVDKQTIVKGALLALCLATAAPVAGAANPDPETPAVRKFGRSRHAHGRFGAQAPWVSLALKHRSELNLTPDQVTELEKIRTQYRNQAAGVRQQLRSVEKELAALMHESPANLVQARMKIEQSEKLRSELRYLRLEALENGKSVLTAQQRDQLKQLVSSSPRGFHRHRGQRS